jgi:hypothetical protein
MPTDDDAEVTELTAEWFASAVQPHRRGSKRAVFVEEAIARQFESDEEIEKALRALLEAATHAGRPAHTQARASELGSQLHDRVVGSACPRSSRVLKRTRRGSFTHDRGLQSCGFLFRRRSHTRTAIGGPSRISPIRAMTTSSDAPMFNTPGAPQYPTTAAGEPVVITVPSPSSPSALLPQQ